MAELTIDGVSYPLRASIGAYKKFEETTGKSVAAVDTTDFVSQVELVYFFAVAGCKFENKHFDITLEDWYELLTIEDLPLLGEVVTKLMTTKKKRAAAKAGH